MAATVYNGSAMRAAVAAFVAVAVAALLAVGCGSLTGFLPSAAAEPADITLPPGFQISVYAGDVPNARQMAAGPDGIVFVGSRSEGKVYAVVNKNGQHRVHVLASGLNQPSGLAFRDGSLYVAAVSRILRFRDVARDLERPPKPEVVSDAYPSDAHHGWKFIAFGPDGRLYVPVGRAVQRVPAARSAAHDHHPTRRRRRPARGGRARRAQQRRASTSSRRPASSGSPTTGATGSATISHRTS